MSRFLQDADILEKLLRASLVGEESEAIAHRLLSFYGTVGKAVTQLDSEISKVLDINSNLTELFDAIHQLNLNVLHRRISDEPFPNSRSNAVAFFKEQFPTRKNYIAQFFYYCGNEFVGFGMPVFGTINRLDFLRREVLSEALRCNATKILPVVGLPDGFSNVDDRVILLFDELSIESEKLEISTTYPSLV